MACYLHNVSVVILVVSDPEGVPGGPPTLWASTFMSKKEDGHPKHIWSNQGLAPFAKSRICQ